MRTRRMVILIFISVTAILVGALYAGLLARNERGVRGKSPAEPLEADLNSSQAIAQDLALSDPRVQDLTMGRPSEVFGVRQVGAHYSGEDAACRDHDCWQVEIYNYDEDAAVTAVVDVTARRVLSVYHQPGVHPGINPRLVELAKSIAFSDPGVIEVLGFQPTQADMAPVDAGLVGSVCETGHLCVSPTFNLEGEILWAVVDLTERRLVGLARTQREPDPPGNAAAFTPLGCPAPGEIDRDGWQLSYETTGTDGLRVYDVSFQGLPVLTSAKLVEWHVDYGDSGFEDITGCGGGGGGFPIPTYGDTQVLDLLDGSLNLIGFEVVQDFRMNLWGNFCNYRYEQHYQFFDDGRFRVVSGAYGKGCGTDAVYRPVARVDMAVAGDGGDSFYRWAGSAWAQLSTEDYLVPYTEAGHGPHQATAEGYNWIVADDAGQGYYIAMSTGQFGDGGRGDDPFVHITRHHPSEGDADIGVIGDCCFDDHRQGPDTFLDGESIDGENLVVWYTPQMVTDGEPGSYYCWTVSGEPNPETYPCWAGPMFTPFDQSIEAGFQHSGPAAVGETVAFTNTSVSLSALNYDWDFGDRSPHATEENPTHQFSEAGYYTVTLAVSNTVASVETSQVVAIGVPPLADFHWPLFVSPGQAVQFANLTIGGTAYLWDFGDGSPQSTAENPSHIYASPGTYTLTLAATNPFGTDLIRYEIVIGDPVTLPIIPK